jgi:hypothetical protein
VSPPEPKAEQPSDDGGRAAPTGRQTTPGELLVSLMDGTASALLRRPVRVRAKTTASGLARGRLDVLVFEVRDLPASGLLVRRMLVRAAGVSVAPGIPPRLKAESVGLKVTVDQAGVDAWTSTVHLPFRLVLSPDGIVVRTGLRGMALTEVETELTVNGALLELRPVRASMLGRSAPLPSMLRGYLPLPPLPSGARLQEVEPADGSFTIYLDLGAVDEPITPDLGRRLARRFTLPALARR